MKQPAPETELEMTKEIDLGVILDTTSPVHLDIPITNRSGRLITIQDLAKDCSCTSVKIDKRTLAPGETATLRVVANLAGKIDGYEGNIIVESDAVERVDQIRIRGRITGQLRIRPGRATLLIGEQREPGNFSVFCDDQNGAWRYAGFTSDDANLAVTLTRRETSATTSVYAGVVDLKPGVAATKYATFQTALVTLSFVNDRLGRQLDLKYGVDVARRRSMTFDPPQITFLGSGAEQRRTFLVQSAHELRLDTARSSSPWIEATLHRIDPRSLRVELVYRPVPGEGNDCKNIACELISEGKTMGSVPISIVALP